MDSMRIIGGTPLKGKVHIAGAKNAALPLMAAALLTGETIHLTNVPHLSDIRSMKELLRHIGAKAEMTTEERIPHASHQLHIEASCDNPAAADYDIVRKMRASIVVLGPLLARFREAMVSLPGGCAIGARPVDLHLKALEALGAEIKIEHGYIHARAPKGLQGGHYTFPTITVTGTENIMMAATLARGKTTLHNAAREPEVSDLAHLLVKMGAKIEGIGTDTLIIDGVSELHGTTHHVMEDRIETGTYMIAAAITNGELELLGGSMEHLPATVDVLMKSGVELHQASGSLFVRRAHKHIYPVDITTAPYPGFATDLQAQMMTYLCLAKGTSSITETIFENRFMHVAELARMGAQIQTHDSTAIVHGIERFNGAHVMATDLRASVSLVLAALAAEGETIIHRLYHLDRGYEYIDEKLRASGAQVERFKEDAV